MIELRQLRHFLAVVDEGGVRRAARRLPLSPSSVARSVKLLETHYGVPLLVRRGRRVEPTAYGRQLADEARALVAGAEGIGRRLGQLADLSRGTLRVGISPSVADVFLPPVGARFLRDHPNVSMETRTGHATEMLTWLVGREVDVAVGEEGPFAIHGGLDILRLYAERVSLWVRSEHPLAQGDEVGVGDLVDYPVISQFLPGGFGSWFEDLCESAARARPGRRVNHAQKCTSYPLLLRLAHDSDAILLSPDRNVQAGPLAGHLQRLAIPDTDKDVQISVVVLRSPPPSPLARRFVEILRESVESAPQVSAAHR